MIKTICVAGAGTMGAGIAQLAAQSGFVTLLFDVNEVALENAQQQVFSGLNILVEKKIISLTKRDDIFQQIRFINNYNDCIADLVIEAIIENIDSKISLIAELEKINNRQTIFVSNTSSLSISTIQHAMAIPEKFAGMHFFNPAPVMKLVELVKGEKTSDETIEKLFSACETMNKTAVVCKDAPGFIVNRVARHYYLEALKLVEDGAATFETVDSIMEATGFKMGPFRLMDMIGIDINLAVSQSMYESFNKAERFVPSPLQISKVKAGELGKKAGKGFYLYK